MPIKTRRILLMNCDRAIEEMMQLCLETIPDCEVAIANSGIELIERAANKNTDAILLYVDETMPDLGWSEIIKAIEQNPLTDCIPLILLTATPQSQDMVEFQKSQGVRAIALSFDLSNLASQISTLLDWK